MPELPEVEHLRLSLIPRLVGRRIADARVHRRDVVEQPAPPRGRDDRRAEPRRIGQAALLVGGLIAELRRAGKQLAIVTDDGRSACFHLGMSGQLRWFAPIPPRQSAPHEHVEWRLDDGSLLVFRDPRRFGGVWLFRSIAALQEERWAALGPDALAITAPELSSRLERSRRAVKAALLDQSVIAGIGNIYADEALFSARLSPLRPASKVRPEQAGVLAEAIRRILRDSISAGGSTLRDYIDGDGNHGNNQHGFAVYGRGGEACPNCGRKLRTLQVAQRTTVMCPRCQR